MREFHAGPTIDSTKMLIAQVAGEFHNEAKRKELCAKLDADMAKLDSARKHTMTVLKCLSFILARLQINILSLSRSGVPNKMLEAMALSTLQIPPSVGKHLSAEVIAADQPDVILQQILVTTCRVVPISLKHCPASPPPCRKEQSHL